MMWIATTPWLKEPETAVVSRRLWWHVPVDALCEQDQSAVTEEGGETIHAFEVIAELVWQLCVVESLIAAEEDSVIGLGLFDSCVVKFIRNPEPCCTKPIELRT